MVEMADEPAVSAAEPVVALARRVPDAPSAAEREAHAVLCEPYRSWCRCCVAGRGSAHDAHRVHGDGELPVIGMDFGYLDEATDANPILFGRDDRQKWIFAITLLDKTCTDDYAWKVPMMTIARYGYPKVVMRSVWLEIGTDWVVVQERAPAERAAQDTRVGQSQTD